MLRIATTTDIPTLVALGCQMWGESPRYSALAFSEKKVEALFAALIASPDGYVAVIDREGIIGAIAGQIAAHWYSDEKIAFEYGVFVAPDKRGAMSAVALIRSFVEWAKANGACMIQVGITTGVEVERTAALYRSLGMQQYGMLFDA